MADMPLNKPNHTKPYQTIPYQTKPMIWFLYVHSKKMVHRTEIMLMQ